MKRSPVGLLLVATLSAACDVRVDENGIRSMRVAEGRAEDVWTRSYTLPANGTFEIVGEDGTIDVSAADGPQVEVRAEREARADTRGGRARTAAEAADPRRGHAGQRQACHGRKREHLGAAGLRPSCPDPRRIPGSRAQRV